MKIISKEYSLLIEEIGVVIEERADLSPLSARIYATLILASNEGLTLRILRCSIKQVKVRCPIT